MAKRRNVVFHYTTMSDDPREAIKLAREAIGAGQEAHVEVYVDWEDEPEVVADYETLPEPRASIPDACAIDVDNAEYVGDPDNGVYYDVALVEKGGLGGFMPGYYWSALVDAEGFTEDLKRNVGPYLTHQAAFEDAQDEAIRWCQTNDVEMTK